MKLSEDYTYGTNVIRAFNEGSIEINAETYTRSLVVSNTLLIEDWDIQHIEQISESHWQALLDHKPELIIIGTGKSLIFPHPSSYASAINMGIGVEFMDTAAACRTYNILLSEDRFVMAGLIL